ncbi:cysteine-rich receptor-like protein kinase 43 isoform X2 [Lycium barbarum]|uniref:cysteine-rich receptor-like protein kinase 43 isoform X2 n=1 Tax=Lycium barbarum TaxID=112863 RepID=UPI00293F1D5C|nr:cysteine-rich receptor-like protein kinase 43 isoform X2 [Lycium barbarum]
MTKPKNFLGNFLKPFFSSSNRGRNEDDLQNIAAQEQRQFAFDVLVTATKNFHPDTKLGEGGFGPVFKGQLSDGRQIAVKKLSHSSRQGMKEFKNEAKLLARVQHRNVVNLLGYCAHGVEKLIVYEYVANESLDKILFKSAKRDVLNWKQRHDIIIGMARGLLYLHEGSHKCIIHRDIKASNILLDDKWIPKIADFGMARLYPEDQTHVNTRVAGTNGYMAPEYVMYGHLSVKADVFSFGVVVLELISGQKNSNFNRDPDSRSLIEWAYKLYKKGRSWEITDPAMAQSAIPDEIAMYVQIGLLCTQSDPPLRPTMQQVVVMLSKNPGSLDKEPTRPGYPGSRIRSRRPGGSSHTGGTSAASNPSTFSYTSSGSHTVSATASTSTLSRQRMDPHGKRPMID